MLSKRQWGFPRSFYQPTITVGMEELELHRSKQCCLHCARISRRVKPSQSLNRPMDLDTIALSDVVVFK